MLEQRERGEEHGGATEHATVVAEQEQGREEAGLRERLVERVEAPGREPVHLLDAVVHRVEPPEERHRVTQTVTPVAPEHHDEGRERDRSRDR